MQTCLDALIISDIHLGSDNCQAKDLVVLLEQIRCGVIQTSRIILNGDVFDSFDFRRLKKNHWKVLSLIRKLSDHIDITWIHGNHDGSLEFISHLLGVNVENQYEFESGGKRILALHGHIFDEFIDKHPWLTMFADFFYCLLQKTAIKMEVLLAQKFLNILLIQFFNLKVIEIMLTEYSEL
jgi:UDP-2,3-diacylglucosamine pyrophosphatase LpxH